MAWALSTGFASAIVVSAREFHYERRRPERTTLYEVVRDNLATLYVASEQGFASALLEKCLRCGSPMKLRAVITEPENVARYLHHVDEATELPARAPARDPPYLCSQVIRRRPAEQLVLVA